VSIDAIDFGVNRRLDTAPWPELNPLRALRALEGERHSSSFWLPQGVNHVAEVER
jgi:hypothetical protein